MTEERAKKIEKSIDFINEELNRMRCIDDFTFILIVEHDDPRDADVLCTYRSYGGLAIKLFRATTNFNKTLLEGGL